MYALKSAFGMSNEEAASIIAKLSSSFMSYYYKVRLNLTFNKLKWSLSDILKSWYMKNI